MELRSPGYPTSVAQRPVDQVRSTAPPMTRTIPFDYVFQFELAGKPTNRVQDVVEISMQGVFVAVSMGYSFVLDERKNPRAFGPTLSSPITLTSGSNGRRVSEITLGEVFAGLESIGVSIERGFRVSPNFVRFVEGFDLSSIPDETLKRAFEPGCGSDDLSFLYTIDVPSTGRELQNKPIHNIAGLGIANGDRPFRPLAKPIAFEPRTSIRIQVEEISTLPGTLYIVLQGYKTLGTGRTPE